MYFEAGKSDKISHPKTESFAITGSSWLTKKNNPSQSEENEHLRKRYISDLMRKILNTYKKPRTGKQLKRMDEADEGSSEEDAKLDEKSPTRTSSFAIAESKEVTTTQIPLQSRMNENARRLYIRNLANQVFDKLYAKKYGKQSSEENLPRITLVNRKDSVKFHATSPSNNEIRAISESSGLTTINSPSKSEIHRDSRREYLSNLVKQVFERGYAKKYRKPTKEGNIDKTTENYRENSKAALNLHEISSPNAEYFVTTESSMFKTENKPLKSRESKGLRKQYLSNLVEKIFHNFYAEKYSMNNTTSNISIVNKKIELISKKFESDQVTINVPEHITISEIAAKPNASIKVTTEVSGKQSSEQVNIKNSTKTPEQPSHFHSESKMHSTENRISDVGEEILRKADAGQTRMKTSYTILFSDTDRAMKTGIPKLVTGFFPAMTSEFNERQEFIEEIEPIVTKETSKFGITTTAKSEEANIVSSQKTFTANEPTMNHRESIVRGIKTLPTIVPLISETEFFITDQTGVGPNVTKLELPEVAEAIFTVSKNTTKMPESIAEPPAEVTERVKSNIIIGESEPLKASMTELEINIPQNGKSAYTKLTQDTRASTSPEVIERNNIFISENKVTAHPRKSTVPVETEAQHIFETVEAIDVFNPERRSCTEHQQNVELEQTTANENSGFGPKIWTTIATTSYSNGSRNIATKHGKIKCDDSISAKQTTEKITIENTHKKQVSILQSESSSDTQDRTENKTSSLNEEAIVQTSKEVFISTGTSILGNIDPAEIHKETLQTVASPTGVVNKQTPSGKSEQIEYSISKAPITAEQRKTGSRTDSTGSVLITKKPSIVKSEPRMYSSSAAKTTFASQKTDEEINPDSTEDLVEKPSNKVFERNLATNSQNYMTTIPQELRKLQNLAQRIELNSQTCIETSDKFPTLSFGTTETAPKTSPQGLTTIQEGNAHETFKISENNGYSPSELIITDTPRKKSQKSTKQFSRIASVRKPTRIFGNITTASLESTNTYSNEKQTDSEKSIVTEMTSSQITVETSETNKYITTKSASNTNKPVVSEIEIAQLKSEKADPATFIISSRKQNTADVGKSKTTREQATIEKTETKTCISSKNNSTNTPLNVVDAEKSAMNGTKSAKNSFLSTKDTTASIMESTKTVQLQETNQQNESTVSTETNVPFKSKTAEKLSTPIIKSQTISGYPEASTLSVTKLVHAKEANKLEEQTEIPTSKYISTDSFKHSQKHYSRKKPSRLSRSFRNRTRQNCSQPRISIQLALRVRNRSRITSHN